MTNSKGRCTSCKKYSRISAMKIVPAGKFCNQDCLLTYANNSTDKLLANVRKVQKKEDNLRKKKFQDNDLKLRKEAAQQAFNKFIRLRDDKEPCISCQKHHTGQYHAGHFKTTAARSDLRFNEDGCNKQCSICNNHLSGNIEFYRPNLIKKIGRERFDALEIQSIIKWTCEMYLIIETKYKAKLKELK